jgi:membrane associated rhomboid family serine protease
MAPALRVAVAGVAGSLILGGLVFVLIVTGVIGADYPNAHVAAAFALGGAGSLALSFALYGLLFWSARSGRDEAPPPADDDLRPGR